MHVLGKGLTPPSDRGARDVRMRFRNSGPPSVSPVKRIWRVAVHLALPVPTHQDTRCPQVHDDAGLLARGALAETDVQAAGGRPGSGPHSHSQRGKEPLPEARARSSPGDQPHSVSAASSVAVGGVASHFPTGVRQS